MIETILKQMPLVAILRGVRPDEVKAIGAALYHNGIRCIEVPLNSPSPFDSIRILANSLPNDCLVGAGTVLSVQDVRKVKEAGGKLIVTPNTNPDVIKAAVTEKIIVMPGIATPTDAFNAVEAGAEYLKLFPASSYGAEHLKAIMAVLPKNIKILAVGGVGAANILEWKTAGAVGFGIASELYKAGDSAEIVAQKAAKICGAISL
ncbi:2-dehydro-3-deoxy-6-phosphogalactonate aldolase [Sphingorhabdus lutea]|uniref:2-dehydro-3-deoxy-6-phosphogalactonate aldolase n=1 Tax=Sphingorhabdus lutea TaxID=1913578 RepID=A0A1L3JA84_9SPHN|nr:2-dehydro-3-deoxy-6-phosphogalactonate aldolase [Sphingorhabdus lutea]APG62042.1 2-dehydro-3-deoxy-6-phosphogalactonate aldolase [Sphingorhabdus lutea]